MIEQLWRSLPEAPDEVAPDGCEVRWLAKTAAASMAHFSLPAGAVTSAVVHRQVEEIWYFLTGSGQMWRRWQDGPMASAAVAAVGESAAGSIPEPADTDIVALFEGVSVTLPPGYHFQLRADSGAPLTAVAVTVPPWPGDAEAVPVEGIWVPSIGVSRQSG